MSREDFRSAFRRACARRDGSRGQPRRSKVTADEPGTGRPAHRQNLAAASSTGSPWRALLCEPFVKLDTTRDQAGGLTGITEVAAQRRPPGNSEKGDAPRRGPRRGALTRPSGTPVGPVGERDGGEVRGGSEHLQSPEVSWEHSPSEKETRNTITQAVGTGVEPVPASFDR